MSKHANALEPAFIQHQRERLTAMRDELLKMVSDTDARERAPKADEAREREEDAQHLAQDEIDGALGAVEAQRLRVIDRALAKIDEGTYGQSDVSGNPIPKARLEAMPEAVLTIQEEEAREKGPQR